MLKITKISVFLALTVASLQAAEFNVQAEKDRLAIVKYFETKFKDPLKNAAQFFPYSTDEELKDRYAKDVKFEDFAIGSYSYALDAKEQYDELNEFPPYEDAIDNGEELYENTIFANKKTFKNCFKTPTDAAKFPYFDDARKEVITLTTAINECLVNNGEKAWNVNKGKMANLQAFFANSIRDEEIVNDVKINSKEAQEAYNRGKEYYYTQRGYLRMSCATCHVQGAGLRVRNEKLSPMLGQVTHFPVYRLKWQELGTLERRLAGCVKDQGQVPPKANDKEMKELIYFLSYMSNGLKFDGPDIRK